MPLITTARIRSWGYYEVTTGAEVLGHVRGDLKVGFVGLMLDGTQVGDFPTAAEAGEAVAARVLVNEATAMVIAA